MYAHVAAGAAVGGVARALLGLAAVEIAGPGLPWATLLANVLGSFAIGFFATLTEPGGRLMVRARTRQFVMTGLCGGFTTFSLFGLETVRFLADRAYDLAAGYVAVSAASWLLAAWLGMSLALRLNRLRSTPAQRRRQPR